jgi:Protein of unknown function (DUF3489)
MPKLSDSQLVVLSTACQRDDGCVFPVTLKLKGNAVGNVLKSLITKGFLKEIPGRADDTIWRYEDGQPLTLKAADTAYDALGIEREHAASDADLSTESNKPAGGDDASDNHDAASVTIESEKAARKQHTARTDSKQAQLIAMLRRAEGATIPEVVSALGWQQHTVRGAIAGALKKKLGLNIVSEKADERGRVYRIAG